MAERLTQGNSQINGFVWQNLRDMQYDTKKSLKNFEKPVLILHGAQDVVDTDIAKTAHEVLLNSWFVIK